jgi:hypothetical protein
VPETRPEAVFTLKPAGRPFNWLATSVGWLAEFGCAA